MAPPGLPLLNDGHDNLRFGLPALKQDALVAHPVEEIQKTHHQIEQETKRKLMELAYGSAFTMRMKIEEGILSRFQRPPGAPCSMLGLEVLTGRVEDFSFEDYLDDPRESETRPQVDLHHAMEVRLGLAKGPAARMFP
ncbi:hypothetical protein CBR_g34012 [Chara braunii]|uniref:Proteasome maturation factor UMP1 n=1 Tax=Chara braunii TaxID=69332 RepID=A0A388LHU7_CHABU|nr:hypothetical protein CBR_g34012 [Chara braunii]|eukprot:GBG81831.1 hypothetical protein CBR_g34012 [Chara braunii]